MRAQIEALIAEYRGGRITRREFIQRAVVFTGSLAVAAGLVDSLRSSPAYAAQVDPDNPALVSAMVEFAGPATTIFAYRSEPKSSGTYPAIVVIHDRSAMTGYLQDVVRRIAKEGFVGLGVD
jgi:carboxymethylenebutenolidase